jgi:hypothetical protein
MGLHGLTRSDRQCRFGSLATSTVVITCMTHLLLLLLLLWDDRRSQGGAVKSTCKDTWAGRCSAKGQTKKLAT